METEKETPHEEKDACVRAGVRPGHIYLAQETSLFVDH